MGDVKMKEAEAARKFISERREAMAKKAAELEAARQEMEKAAEELNAVNDSLSFEKFKEARRNYEDAKGYYDMLQRAQQRAETATDNDYSLYREYAGGLLKAFNAEEAAAGKEAVKPAQELEKVLQKHIDAQQLCIDLDQELKEVLHVQNINCGPHPTRGIANKGNFGILLNAVKKYNEGNK